MSYSEEPQPRKGDPDGIRGGRPRNADRESEPDRPPKKKSGIAIPLIIGLTLLGFCCIGIIVVPVAIGLLLPAVSKVQNAAQRQQAMANMNQLALAVHNAHDQNKTLPPYNGPYGGRAAAPYTFHVHLLPFIEQQALSNNPAAGAATNIPVFVSAADPTTTGGLGVTNYPVNIRLYYSNGGKGGLTNPSAKPKWTQFADGISNTLLFATTYQNCGNTPKATSDWLDDKGLKATFGTSTAMWQQAPAQAACLANGTAVSLRPESIQVVMGDRATRNLAPTISPAVWAAVHTPSGGEPSHDLGDN